jgi:hypothetical protein
MGTAYAISPNGEYVAGWDDQPPFSANGWVVYFDELLFDTFVGMNTAAGAGPFISVFPNPATEQVRITSSETITMVTIFNGQGQEVARHNVRDQAGVIDISALSSGVYTLRATSQDASSCGQRGEAVRRPLRLSATVQRTPDGTVPIGVFSCP